MNISNEVIWVTGATSGLGLSLAEQLAAKGATVIASGRNLGALEGLQATYPAKIRVLPFDVTDQSRLGQVKEKLASLTKRLDRVYLNAGTCEYLDPVRPDWSMVNSVMDVNFSGMVNTVSVALEFLKRSPRGHIVGIGSQASQLPFPRAEAYGASKAAMRYFLESLRMDVKQYGIDVSIVLPGFVETPLTRRNNFPMPFIMSADAAAERIITAMEKRKFLYAFPKRLSLVLRVMSCFPKLWLALNKDKSAKNENREIHA